MSRPIEPSKAQREHVLKLLDPADLDQRKECISGWGDGLGPSES